MNLPPLTLPKVPIPFDNIPEMLHPMVVHFAIALPVVVLLFEIINLVVKKRAIGIVSFLLLLISSATIAISYLTGNVDVSHIEVLTNTLQEHQILGTYLVVFSMIVVVLKLISALWQTGIVKTLYLILLMLFVIGVYKLSVNAIDFVYQDGINVKQVEVLQKRLNVTDSKFQKLDNNYKILLKEQENLKIKLQEEISKNYQKNKKKEITSDSIVNTTSSTSNDVGDKISITKDKNITKI